MDVHRMEHHSKILSIKYHEQKFCIKFPFSGQRWTKLSIEKSKEFQFLGCLLKISNSILNFNTDAAKTSIIYDLLFLIATYFPKNDNKHPSEMWN